MLVRSGPDNNSLLRDTPLDSTAASKSTRILSFLLGWYTPKWGRYQQSLSGLRSSCGTISAWSLSKIFCMNVKYCSFITGFLSRVRRVDVRRFIAFTRLLGRSLTSCRKGSGASQLPFSFFFIPSSMISRSLRSSVEIPGLLSWFVRTNTLRPRPSSKGLPMGGGVFSSCSPQAVGEVSCLRLSGLERDEQWGSTVVEDLGLERRDFYLFVVAIETVISKNYPTEVQPLAPRRVSGSVAWRMNLVQCGNISPDKQLTSAPLSSVGILSAIWNRCGYARATSGVGI